MNKELAYNFSQFSGLSSQTVSNPLEEIEPEFINDDLQMILDEIFAVDPISGVPRGDIAYYLSPNGNPQVREWIINNLLQPRSSQSGSSIDGLTDDLIVECSRRENEDIESYAARLSSIRDEANKNIEDLKQNSDG